MKIQNVFVSLYVPDNFRHQQIFEKMGSTPNLRSEVATLIKSLTRQTETLGTSLKPPRCPGTTTERGARYHVGTLVGPNASGGVLGLECCDLRVGQKYIVHNL